MFANKSATCPSSVSNKIQPSPDWRNGELGELKPEPSNKGFDLLAGARCQFAVGFLGLGIRRQIHQFLNVGICRIQAYAHRTEWGFDNGVEGGN